MDIYSTGAFLASFQHKFVSSLLQSAAHRTYTFSGMFHIAFPNDPTSRKAIVYGVYLVEVVQTILLTYAAFSGFAKGFGNVNGLTDNTVLWLSIPVLTSVGEFGSLASIDDTHCQVTFLVALVVQLLYAFRIYKIAGGRFVAGIIALVNEILDDETYSS